MLVVDKYMIRIQVTYNMMEDNVLQDLRGHRSERYWSVVAHFFLTAFFKHWVTLAHFQSPGTWPVVSDWLNINCRNGAISSAASFSTQQEMPSGPLAFFVLIFLSRDTLPLVWNSSGSISETPLLSISGIVSTSSSVKTALNWLLKISALALLSVTVGVFQYFQNLKN